jgi:anti-anti-sigma factor
MRIQRSSQQGCVVLTMAGRLDLAAVPEVQRAILKQLAEHPPAIICDLAQVEAIDPLCAEVFTSIQHPALGWPGTALVLCGTRRAVADTLVRGGVARRLAMHPSLEQALRYARARPPRLQERLALGPVPTAVRASRAFVREVCDRWGLQELAEPAALLASELVTTAVVHARTALELRVKLRGPRLHVDVRDQDPNLVRLLAAKEGGDRGRGLAIVDQVASAWGVRQRKAGGKTVWFTLDLPTQHADMTGRGPRLSASTRTAAMAVGPDMQEGGAAEALSPPGRDLMWDKLAPPTLRAGLIQRSRLASLLQTGVQTRLCLLAAPAGSGKTTLLGQWRAASGGGRAAWVSLDESDNDPTRFWTHVIEALRTVEPSLGTAALAALPGPSVDLHRVVLPSLGELAAVDPRLVLVLDDYHLVTNATCLHTLGVFLEQLPAGIRLVLSTQVDPPLPLATLRARGELAELRAAELQFTDQEASELLNGAMGLDLGAEDVARLVERTEGWAAGLVLAGLALRGRQDPSAFVAWFHGDDHHVAGFLVAEVLARQPEAVRGFLLGTSVLERLSGPLCDAVLRTEGSAELLGELEASNLLLVPLDDHREWYRYQQLFGELLRLELNYREPTLVPVLHRRAAAWHRQAGNLKEASYHATAAESSPSQCAKPALLVGELARHATGDRGALAGGLPEQAIMVDLPAGGWWPGPTTHRRRSRATRWVLDRRPVGVFLALNPGQAALGFQGRLGLFADEIRHHGTYSVWAATWPYLRDPWVAAMGPNRYLTSRLGFLGTRTGQPTLPADAMVTVELYPWHSTAVTAPMRPDPGVVREFVWQPVRELGAPVFAFGKPWFGLLADGLGLQVVDRLGWWQALRDGGVQPIGAGPPRRGWAGGSCRVAPWECRPTASLRSTGLA